MKINIDLKGAFGYYGIANYKRNLAIQLLRFQDLEMTGCYNWCRAATRQRYNWYHGDLRRSLMPEKLVYGKNWFSGFSYEMTMGSNADLNLFLTYLLPNLRFNAPVISAIHDIILLKARAESHQEIEAHDTILRRTISLSEKIITVSKASKADLVEYYHLQPEKIAIVHNGINVGDLLASVSSEQEKRVKKKYGLPERYILFFGGYRKHKNLERLLQAYSFLNASIRREVKVVFTNKSAELQRLASELNIDNDVVFAGFADERDKATVYKMADLVYYASLYEGFGVPVIEAQICKTPVITSNTSSLPEASGGYAKLVDPYNVDEIYNAIRDIIDGGADIDKMVEQGYCNALQYTWERSAQEMYDVLRDM